MGLWGHTPDGERVFIEDTDVAAAQKAGIQFEEGAQVTAVAPLSGEAEQVEVDRGYLGDTRVETPEAAAERRYEAAQDEAYGGLEGKAKTFAENTADSLLLGGYSAGLRAFGEEGEFRERARRNPGTAIAGQITGAIAPALVSGGATAPASAGRMARLLAKTPVGLLERQAARVGTRIGGKAGFAAREGLVGAGIGAGQGIHETAMSDDPVTLEGAISNISSAAVYGGAFGAGGSILGKAAEKGLLKARDALKARGAKAAAAGKAGQPVEGAAELVGSLKAYRASTREVGDLYLLTGKAPKGSKLRIAGGRHKKALRKLDSLLDTPKILETAPWKARESLQRAEQTLLEVIEEAPALREQLAAAGAKAGGKRLTALESVEGMLAQNRALQETVEQLDEAGRLAKMPQADSLPQQMVQGAAFSGVMGMAAPVLGPAAVPLAAVVSKKAGQLAFGRLAKAAGKTEQRMAAALERFLGKASKGSRVASPLTSKVLTSARFGPEEKDGRPIKTGNKTADAFRAREREIRKQVSPSPKGMLTVTRPARQAIADNLSGLRGAYPHVADKLEALSAARLEFLASKLPQRAGRTDTLLGGPDRWSPGPTAIARFARYVAAAEDPAGIVERMVDARMTTEDAEVLRELYPSLYEAIQLDLTMRLPELRERLPRKKRLMLSILSGVPIEPGMDPRVLNRLQSHFAEEPGSEGGTQAPQAKPQFGSISAPEPTAAQERAG